MPKSVSRKRWRYRYAGLCAICGVSEVDYGDGWSTNKGILTNYTATYRSLVDEIPRLRRSTIYQMVIYFETVNAICAYNVTRVLQLPFLRCVSHRNNIALSLRELATQAGDLKHHQAQAQHNFPKTHRIIGWLCAVNTNYFSYYILIKKKLELRFPTQQHLHICYLLTLTVTI